MSGTDQHRASHGHALRSPAPDCMQQKNRYHNGWHRPWGLLSLIAGCVLFGLGPVLAQTGTWVYVTNNFTHSVSVIDAATNAVIATVPVGEFPEGVAVHPDPLRTVVYVANNGPQIGDPGHTVSVIDRLAVVATVEVGDGPRGVAVHPAGTFVYVANAIDGTVSVINTATNTVSDTVTVGNGPAHVIVHPAGTFVYVTNGSDDTVSVIDAATNIVTATVPVGDGPHGLDVHPAGTFLYVVHTNDDILSIIDTATNTVVANVTVEPCSAQPAVHPAGTFVYVTSACNDQSPQVVSVIETAGNTVIATVPVGIGGGFISPHGVEVDPAGTFAYVANIFDNSVSVIDTATNTLSTTVLLMPALGDVGNGPVDVAILESDCLDVTDTDKDGIPDACDPDDDDDGCLDGDDDDPLSNIQAVGTWVSIFCNPSGGVEYGFAGENSDDDRLLNCMDPDDDNDGIPDEEDDCPVSGDVLICVVFRDCPVTVWWDVCGFGSSCVEFLVLIGSLINPAPLIVDTFAIVNDTLYLLPAADSSVGELANTIAGNAQLTNETLLDDRVGNAGDLLRMELWTKDDDGQPDRFVALIAEYDPTQVRVGNLQQGEWLAVHPSLDPPLSIATSWTAGAAPGTILIDTDADGRPDPFDNCTFQPNGPTAPDQQRLDQRDTDGDHYGNVCDGDFDNDGRVTADDHDILICSLVGPCGPNPDVDMDGDGAGTQQDHRLWHRSFERGVPGPSGLIEQ